jgi:hypothetical protein
MAAPGADERAVTLRQAFKWQVVCSLPREDFTLTAEEVRRVARALEERGEGLSSEG